MNTILSSNSESYASELVYDNEITHKLYKIVTSNSTNVDTKTNREYITTTYIVYVQSSSGSWTEFLSTKDFTGLNPNEIVSQVLTPASAKTNINRVNISTMKRILEKVLNSIDAATKGL